MYEETKRAINKAFEVSKILFFMGVKKYNELLLVTSKINPPTIQDIEEYVENGWTMEDAIIEILRERYSKVAIDNGFTEQQGLAMLEYAAMLEELKDE